MYQQITFYTPQSIIDNLNKEQIFKDLLLVWTGEYINAKGHIVNNRCLKDYVLIYCIGGIGWLELMDNRYIIKKGDLFICPPNLPHSYGADEVNPWTKYYIHFRGEQAYEFVRMLGISAQNPVINIGTNIKIIQLFDEIFSTLKLGYTTANMLSATGQLYKILSHINILRTNSTAFSKGNVNLENLILFMLDNLERNINLDDFVAYTQVSKYHLVRIFKKKTGYTPVDYFIRLKIQKACELLNSQALSVTEISRILNFSDTYYFSKVFKKVMGLAPSLYRKTQP